MLEVRFVVPASAQRLRSCVFGDYLDEFFSSLIELGYRAASVRHKLWVLSDLAHWMANVHLGLAELDERRVEEYIDLRRRRGRTCRGFRSTGLLLIEQLRCAGVIPRPEVPLDNSSEGALLRRYEVYLRQERALAQSTISRYLTVARELIAQSIGAGRCPEVLSAGAIRDFLLARVRRVAPRPAQLMGSALRSFLRFLFLRAETGLDLSLAIPTVRQWRLSNVPRYLPSPVVERLLRACDLGSSTGRRNHAILLLLARLGLRAREVVDLELGDLNWRIGEIVVHGKGLVSDRLPLLPEVGDALALYLQKDRPSSSSRRVFLRCRAPHRGLGNASSVSTIVMRALGRAGLTSTARGAHLLRHSLATLMVRRGASFTEVGQVLRHRSPRTTEIYAKLDFDSLSAVAMPWPTHGGA